MKHRLAVIDTSWLCVLLAVPGKDRCDGDLHLTTVEAQLEFEEKVGQNYRFVLPLATVIETGKSYRTAGTRRRETAQRLVEIVQDAAKQRSPWIVFSQQLDNWQPEALGWLDTWPDFADARLSIGDMTIKQVADYYSRMGYEVEMLTCDKQLKVHQPASPVRRPRRDL
ncbi:MAG: hypothetical protein OHK0039_39810 [Bacteroidia bacterium]